MAARALPRFASSALSKWRGGACTRSTVQASPSSVKQFSLHLTGPLFTTKIMTLKKEIKYLELAQQFANSFSKDTSTQVGAFFLHRSEFTILSAGYNGIPRGCDDSLPERHARPLKYEFFEHAERNAIYNAVRDIFRGSTLVCSAPMEIDDVRALISVGVAALACAELPAGDTAKALLAEAGVVMRDLPSDAAFNEAVFSLPGRQAPLVRASGPLTGGHHREDSAVCQAIFRVAYPLLANSTVVVGPLPPCASCARALASVGVKRVVSYRPTAEQNLRWGASFAETRALFDTVGIALVET